MMEKDLAGYPVVVETPVAWGEMDAFGHVNNIVYFRYFETARIAYFARLDVPEFLGRDPTGPILAETTCRFRAALAYPDTVSVGARVANVGEDRFVMPMPFSATGWVAWLQRGKGPWFAAITGRAGRRPCRKSSRPGSMKSRNLRGRALWTAPSRVPGEGNEKRPAFSRRPSVFRVIPDQSL